MDARELWGWAIRSVALAWPSAMVAIGFGPRSGEQLVAIVCGIAVFALLFARVASSEWLRATDARRPAWGALETAVWVKAAWVLSGVLAMPLALGMGFRDPWWTLPFFAGFFLDELTGALAVSVGSHVRYALGLPDVPLHESFFLTLLATLSQGALIALGLVPVAFVVLVVRQVRERRSAFSNEVTRSL